MRKIYLFLFSLLSAGAVSAQVSLTNAAPAYSQDFDGMGATLNLPANWRIGASTTSPTWAAGVSVVTQQASSGSPSAGGTYNFGTSASERAIGAMTSNSFASPNNPMVAFVNGGTTNITSLTVSYDAERYRVNGAAASIQFFYSTNGTVWNAVTDGDIAASSFPTGSSVYNFTPGLTIPKTGIAISSLNIAPGSNFYLRWLINTTGSSSQGIAIDNISVTATYASSVSGLSTITAGPVAAPATISSLVNSSVAASTNFSFTITDDGSTNDADPTLINQIVIGAGANNDALLNNWTQAIAGAELSDGTNTVTGTVTATAITFGSLPVTSGAIGYIADNASKNYTVKVWLNTVLGGTLPTTIDGKQLEFNVQTSSISTAGSGSSGIAPSQSVSSGASTNVVAVTATQLAFIQNTTTPTGLNTAMTPAVTVSANDVNGNRDLGFTGDLRVTSTGTLSGSPVVATAVAGVTTFAALTHTATGTGLTLSVQRDGTLDWTITSTPFDIQLASSASDYFRSAVSGNWNSAATWETSADGLTWIASTLAPTAAANTITIRNGHTVTVTTSATADQIEILSGGVLENASITGNRLTVADGAGDDLIIHGGGVYHVTSGLGYTNYQTISTGATVLIQTNGIIRLGTGGSIGGSGQNGFLVTATTYIWENGAIFDWNTTAVPATTGATFFPDAMVATPIFRVSAPLTNLGGGSALTVNGVLEANANISFTGNSDKIFRNGIIGTGNVSITNGTGALVINGTAATLGGTGTITANANGLRLGVLTVVTMQSAKTVNGDVNLMNGGSIELGNNNLTVSGDILNYSTTNYVRTNGTGMLQLNTVAGTTRYFPVGNSTYNPVSINNGSSFDWSVRVEDAVNNVVSPFNTSKAINRTWHVSPSATVTSAPVVTFGFDDADDNQLVNPAAYNGDAIRTVRVWHYNGSAWVGAGSIETMSPSNGVQVIALTGQLDFSPFAISKTTSALPVNFGNVKAAQQGTGVRIDWSNLTELNVLNYSVERSADGRNFSAIGDVSARINNGEKADYFFVDATPLRGVNYYRIKSAEGDGRNKLSIVVKVDLSNGQATVVVLYPNPINKGQQLSLQATSLAKGTYTIRVVNMQGQQLVNQVFVHQGGAITEAVQLPANTQAGMYQLIISGSDQQMVRPFVIQ
jgi:hypothetical protein